MRNVFTIAFLCLLASAAQAIVIQPLARPNETPDRTAAEATIAFDRAHVPELARMTVRPRPRPSVTNLRAIADVETFSVPISIRSAHPSGAAPSVIGKIVADGAASLRLRVTTSTPGIALWLAGEHDEAFVRFEPSDDATWTPTTRGATVYIAAEGGGASLSLTQLAIEVGNVAVAASSCVKDAACVGDEAPPELAAASRAVAMIRFVRGAQSYVCTGSLLRDASGSGTPFFLTAQHCIGTAEEAASIEAIWDDRSPGCGMTTGARTTSRTYGAELLVASASTDVALLRLSKLPPNRVFLTIERSPLAEGTKTYRLSHAGGGPQSYAAGSVRLDGAGCTSAPRPNYIYSSLSSGAVASGSSGAPLLLPGLRVAGQLLGRCGASPDDACAIYNEAVDGAIAASWPLLAPYLDPPQRRRRRAAA